LDTLHRAAYSRHLEIVKLLVVEFKADVNDKWRVGFVRT
jgi:hypothetical protein